MKILITYRHFWPDSPPYASMLRSIANRLVREGHQVSILCEQPCYKPSDGKIEMPYVEEIDGVQIHRLPKLPLWSRLNIVNSFSKLLFPIRAYWFCIRNFREVSNFDLVWTATIPPVISGTMGALLSRRYGALFLYHCQDLYPEIAIHMKLIKPRGLVARMMTLAEKKTRQNADVLVSLSKDMEKTINQLINPTHKHLVINNFLLEDFNSCSDATVAITKRPPSPFPSKNTINIIFAGNIGNFQGLDKIALAFIKICKETNNLHLTFMGEGKYLETLKSNTRECANISFIPHAPYVHAQTVIKQADYGLVSLEPNIYKFAYPSKALTYLGLGIPLAVVIEPNSELSKTITTHNIGYQSKSNSVEDTMLMLKTISENKNVIHEHKVNAQNYYQSFCSRESALDKWASLIATLETKYPDSRK